MILTPDYLFSYWLFFWYLLYITGIFTKYNPKISIILGLVMNLYIIYLMIYNKQFYMLFLVITVIFIIKIIPLISLRNTKIKLNDFLFGFFLFLIYCLWITLYYKQNVLILITDLYFNDTYIKNIDISQSLIIIYLDKIIKYIKT
jgi:hypothetical protein